MPAASLAQVGAWVLDDVTAFSEACELFAASRPKEWKSVQRRTKGGYKHELSPAMVYQLAGWRALKRAEEPTDLSVRGAMRCARYIKEICCLHVDKADIRHLIAGLGLFVYSYSDRFLREEVAPTLDPKLLPPEDTNLGEDAGSNPEQAAFSRSKGGTRDKLLHRFAPPSTGDDRALAGQRIQGAYETMCQFLDLLVPAQSKDLPEEWKSVGTLGELFQREWQRQHSLICPRCFRLLSGYFHWKPSPSEAFRVLVFPDEERNGDGSDKPNLPNPSFSGYEQSVGERLAIYSQAERKISQEFARAEKERRRISLPAVVQVYVDEQCIATLDLSRASHESSQWNGLLVRPRRLILKEGAREYLNVPFPVLATDGVEFKFEYIFRGAKFLFTASEGADSYYWLDSGIERPESALAWLSFLSWTRILAPVSVAAMALTVILTATIVSPVEEELTLQPEQTLDMGDSKPIYRVPPRFLPRRTVLKLKMDGIVGQTIQQGTYSVFDAISGDVLVSGTCREASEVCEVPLDSLEPIRHSRIQVRLDAVAKDGRTTRYEALVSFTSWFANAD